MRKAMKKLPQREINKLNRALTEEKQKVFTLYMSSDKCTYRSLERALNAKKGMFSTKNIIHVSLGRTTLFIKLSARTHRSYMLCSILLSLFLTSESLITF